MERHHLICMLVGKHCTLNSSLSGMDLKILIDESLFNAKFTPLGSESGDDELLDELIGETMMYVMGQGINRKQRRS